MPRFRVEKFKLRLTEDEELNATYELLRPFILVSNEEHELALEVDKVKRWRKELEEKNLSDKSEEDNSGGKVIPLPPKPWYQRTVRPIYKYAASLLLFGLIYGGYWYNGIPQRSADDVLKLAESRGAETGCYAQFEKVLIDYNQNEDPLKAIQSLKSETYTDKNCTALSKFYEAALSVKAKKYDEAKVLLRQVIQETEKESPVNNEAEKLLDTL